MVIEDIVGRKFGRLSVVSREPNRGKAYWLCLCDCGQSKVAQGLELRTGRVKSCGCLRRETAAATAKTRKPRKSRIEGRTEKYCPECQRTLPIEEFGKNRTSTDGLTAYCKPCHSKKGRLNREKKWGSTRHYHLVQRYGITAEEVDVLLEKQRGLCAICSLIPDPKLRNPWHVDHDHSTGRVRGILCHSCNTALGNFKDDPEILRKALEYLQDPEVQTWIPATSQ